MKLVLVISFLLLASVRAETPPPEKPFPKIWLKSEIVPMNFSWKDLGLSQESSFTMPITSAWEKWLAANLPATVGEVSLCSEACMAFGDEWEMKTQNEVLIAPESEFSHGVWLKVAMNIWKLPGPQGQNAYRWEGRVVLQDMRTKRKLGIVPLAPEERRYFELDQAQVNSALGNQVYRTPSYAFTQLMKVLGKGHSFNRVAFLKVTGQRQLLDALALTQMLETRGASLGLQAELSEFSRTDAQLVCFYQGEEKSFNDLLSQLKELKSSERYTLVNQSSETQYVLQLVAE